MTSCDDSPVRRTLTIVNQRGLHARASAKFVKCAEGFDAEIQVTRDGQQVPGTSIMGLLMLGAAPGATIEVETSGREACQAMAAIVRMVEAGFDEE